VSEIDPRRELSLTINGRRVTSRADADRLLVDLLREDLGLTGTKYGCGTGDCGACAVLVDGAPVNACLVYAIECEESRIETIEHVSERRDGAVVVEALLRNGGVQCGICTPGFVVTAVGTLDGLGADPTREEVQRALAGNLCRCTGYYGIIAAVQQAAAEITTVTKP
jgi:carbon-monoxide dehydrogenase small subunit